MDDYRQARPVDSDRLTAMVDEFQKQCWTPTGRPGAGSVLIVEDDKRLMQCLARAMEARGFKVMIAGSVCDGLAQIQLSAR